MTIVGNVIVQVAAAEGEIGDAVTSKRISGKAGEILRERFVNAIFELTVREGLRAVREQKGGENGETLDAEGQRPDETEGD